MILPIRRDAGSAPPLLGLDLCTDGAGLCRRALRALQKQIVHCIDPAALGMDTGDDSFFQDTDLFPPDPPRSQRFPVLRSLHSWCCGAQVCCKITLCQPLN